MGERQLPANVLTGESKGSPDFTPSEPGQSDWILTAGPRSQEGGSGSDFYSCERLASGGVVKSSSKPFAGFFLN